MFRRSYFSSLWITLFVEESFWSLSIIKPNTFGTFKCNFKPWHSLRALFSALEKSYSIEKIIWINKDKRSLVEKHEVVEYFRSRNALECPWAPRELSKISWYWGWKSCQLNYFVLTAFENTLQLLLNPSSAATHLCKSLSNWFCAYAGASL